MSMSAPVRPPDCDPKARFRSAQRRPDFTIDQNWFAYSPAEHNRWDRLFERSHAVLRNRACDEFLGMMEKLELSQSGIPDMEKLSSRLGKLTGWGVVPVLELVPDEVFFDHLANRRFPAGAFIRSEAELDYLQEPDIFHDVFGHVPLLAIPAPRRALRPDAEVAVSGHVEPLLLHGGQVVKTLSVGSWLILNSIGERTAARYSIFWPRNIRRRISEARWRWRSRSSGRRARTRPPGVMTPEQIMDKLEAARRPRRAQIVRAVPQEGEQAAGAAAFGGAGADGCHRTLKRTGAGLALQPPTR